MPDAARVSRSSRTRRTSCGCPCGSVPWGRHPRSRAVRGPAGWGSSRRSWSTRTGGLALAGGRARAVRARARRRPGRVPVNATVPAVAAARSPACWPVRRLQDGEGQGRRTGAVAGRRRGAGGRGGRRARPGASRIRVGANGAWSSTTPLDALAGCSRWGGPGVRRAALRDDWRGLRRCGSVLARRGRCRGRGRREGAQGGGPAAGH